MPSVVRGKSRRTSSLPEEALLASYGLFFADEAMSVMRHDILNRVTAMGALGFELRRLQERQGDRVGQEAEEATGDETHDPLRDLNRQIALICQTVSRRLTPVRSVGEGKPGRSPAVTPAGALDAAAALCGLPPTTLRVSGQPRLEVAMGREELAVALLCVLENAIEAAAGTRQGRRSPIEVEVGMRADGQVTIQVDDRGGGLGRGVAGRAFERFFSTKKDHAGLGLCVARTVLTRFQGEISIANRPGRVGGARVTVVLAPARRRRQVGA